MNYGTKEERVNRMAGLGAEITATRNENTIIVFGILPTLVAGFVGIDERVELSEGDERTDDQVREEVIRKASERWVETWDYHEARIANLYVVVEGFWIPSHVHGVEWKQGKGAEIRVYLDGEIGIGPSFSWHSTGDGYSRYTAQQIMWFYMHREMWISEGKLKEVSR